MTVASPRPGDIAISAQGCVNQAVRSLMLAEQQLAAREARGTDHGWPLESEHTRNRIELGAAWCLLAEALEGDRP